MPPFLRPVSVRTAPRLAVRAARFSHRPQIQLAPSQPAATVTNQMWRRSATTKVEGQNKSDIRDDGTVRKFNKDGTSFNMGYLVAGLTTLIVAYTYWLMTGKPQDSAQTSIKRDPGEVQRQLGTNQR